MPTTVTTSESGPVHVVHVAGEIDVTSAAILRDALEALIADGRRRLTLDLTEVTYRGPLGHMPAWRVDVPGGSLTVNALPGQQVELAGPAALVAEGTTTLLTRQS